ncbi:MAG: N-acetyl-alpha-D-glucosaminyl L-malate synthase BshA [Chitinophagales bacterium]|jgi:N-acetyl-alpha-D-glucosaminyl L-malate synthase BshA|nr:N-acetyl-alpha-D-glucosaminyl L-malate synthase BshA [Chitinophagales bacterium]HNL06823.1 N-acetyl-alpha-D-glucosaminyl L-malate synthase BshA [Chitinophagales bacterium]
MKIGIVCYPTYGGSGVVATELGKALAEKGHNVHFVAYSQPARLSSFHENINYHEVSFANYPLFAFPPYEAALTSKLVDVVRYHRLNILHVHYAIPHATAAFLAKQILLQHGTYIPVVTTLHGTDITLVGKDPTFQPVVEYSINMSDGVTAVSESLRQQTYDTFAIHRPIEVIPNFIDFRDFQKFNKDHFKKALAPNGERILMHTSNFRKVKRIEDVVQVFALVHQKIPAKLLLVGDGPERIKAEQLCRDLDLCDDIRFLGKQDAIGELLAIADLFLMPSEAESFGLAALEAMACEVPVVSSNAGGIPEVNIHAQTGYLSNVGDVEDMARHAISILNNDEVLAQFRKNALEQAQQFDINRILPLYEQYYETVIAQNIHKNNV